MEKRSNWETLKVGDRISETQYYEVSAIYHDRIRVKNERGFEFDISGNIVSEGMYSADQFTETKKLTRTELVEVLENAGDTVFTVNFNKQPTPKEVADKLQGFSKENARKAATKLLKGDERTLTGYLLQTEPKMGRSQVIDLEIAPKGDGVNRIRQVDHRTLNWIILKNIRYMVK